MLKQLETVEPEWPVIEELVLKFIEIPCFRLLLCQVLMKLMKIGSI